MSLHELLLLYSIAAGWCNKPHLADNIFDVVLKTRSVPKCRRELVSCLKKANESQKVENCFDENDREYR